MKSARQYLLLFLLLLVSFFTYQDSFDHPFTYLDDQVQVVNNANIRSLDAESIKSIFSSTSVGMYQPLSTLLYAIIYQFDGINPWAYHFASWLLHLLNGLLIFRILRQLKFNFSISYFLSVIFLLHPMQVESVSWVSAFSNLCFTCFYLLSFSAYIKFKQKQQFQFYLFSLLAFLLSLLAKSSAVTLPLVLIAYDYFQNSKLKLKKQLNKIPLLALSLIFGIITLNSREAAGHLSDLSVSFDLFDRIFLVAYSILFYPFKFLLPLELSAFYPYPELQNGFLPWIYYAALPALLALSFLIYRFREKRRLWFGALFYLLSISVTLQLVPVGNQLTTDRYLYLPMIGLLLMIGSLIKVSNQRKIWFATAIIGFSLAAKTYDRTKVWANDQLIWEDVLEKHPQVAQAHNNLGSYLLRAGKAQQAFTHFNQAVKLKPYYADAYSNRGNLYSQMGKSQKAMADFNQALKLRPHADAYFNRANEKVKAGNLQAAIQDYTESIGLKPSADAFTNRAFAYLRLQQVDNAKADLQKAFQQNPNFAQAYFLKGMMAQQQNQTQTACAQFQKAAQLGHSKAKQALVQFCR
ncbi:MAG: tetratricopeptide repeat protein [Vicingaceae bacterium]